MEVCDRRRISARTGTEKTWITEMWWDVSMGML